MEGIPGKQGHKPAGSCWAPGASLGSLRFQHSTGNAKPNARTQLLPWVGCWVSVYPLLPIFSCLLTHLFEELSASVCLSTASDSLYLDK